MATQFMLMSALNRLVIGIIGDSTATGVGLEVSAAKIGPPKLNPQGGVTPGALAPDQTWEVKPDPAGSKHFIIQNPHTGHCIGIAQNSTTPGAALHVGTVKTSNNQNELWDFLPDQYGSDYFVIQNPQTGFVIEIEDGNSRTGAKLVVNRMRLFDNNFQLWGSTIGQNWSGPDGTLGLPDPSLLPAVEMVASAPPLQGNSQYVWLPKNQSTFLTSITVTLDIIEDLVSDGAFSVQINGNAPYPPPKGTSWDAQWSQFGLFQQNNNFVLFQQVWHQLGAGPGGKNDPLETATSTSSPILNTPFSNNTVPAGTKIVLTLTVDKSKTYSDYVTGISGKVYNGAGVEIGSGTWTAIGQASVHGGTAPESAMSPLAALQVVVVGLPGNTTDHFSRGMGTITLQCTPGVAAQVSPLNAPTEPNPHTIGTNENSNCYYGVVQSGNHQQFVQPFGVPNPRITSVSGDWTFAGAGLLPNSKLTVTGGWGQDFPYKGIGNLIPIPPVVAGPDGSFSAVIKIDNPDAPYATGKLTATFTDSSGNWAQGIVETPSGSTVKFASNGGLGPP